jgi:hypothetical protein
MTRRVKQGDPLSPLLFNIAMDPLLEAISAQKNGYKWDESGLHLEALCYADDNGLLIEDPKEMQINLDVVNEFCQATGMILNAKKSFVTPVQLLTLTPRYFVLSTGAISGSSWLSTSHLGWKSLITKDLFA